MAATRRRQRPPPAGEQVDRQRPAAVPRVRRASSGRDRLHGRRRELRLARRLRQGRRRAGVPAVAADGRSAAAQCPGGGEDRRGGGGRDRRVRPRAPQHRRRPRVRRRRRGAGRRSPIRRPTPSAGTGHEAPLTQRSGQPKSPVEPSRRRSNRRRGDATQASANVEAGRRRPKRPSTPPARPLEPPAGRRRPVRATPSRRACRSGRRKPPARATNRSRRQPSRSRRRLAQPKPSPKPTASRRARRAASSSRPRPRRVRSRQPAKRATRAPKAAARRRRRRRQADAAGTPRRPPTPKRRRRQAS